MRRLVKYFLFFLGGFVVLLAALYVYVMIVAKIDFPEVKDQSILQENRIQKDTAYYVLKNNWFRHSNSGLYELYVEGEPFERGVVLGKLMEHLVKKQEIIFNKQIEQLVPSPTYRYFLTMLIGWFNRDLDKNVIDEFKQEIYGVSFSAVHDYDNIAPAYQRMLNYHAAHDIGHALQNMALVGCTSFATWNSLSEDGSLIIGRNFDFFVGEEFARDKIIAFYKPSAGHSFMTVTWAGMTGVVSGMNDKGLTVTLNAAKSDIPTASATPVSLVAREILQYASNISEAYAIAKKRKTFVAESFLIGSASDKRAAVIEKSASDIALYETQEDWLIDTNHYLSEKMGTTELNQEHIKTSASVYRYDRVKELMANKKLNVNRTISILRDQKGLRDCNIGFGNEKAVNQLVAHHAIVFQPEKRIVWVSTSPYQLGKFVAYNLNKIFSGVKKDNSEVYDSLLTIPEDHFMFTKNFTDYTKYFKYRFPFQPRTGIQPDSLVKWNPVLYHSYVLAGNEEYDRGAYARAARFFSEALKKEIPTTQEKEYILKRLKSCEIRME
jgi:isopenicillin-N N-acyltransferase like protein